jgi:hypothetical protein
MKEFTVHHPFYKKQSSIIPLIIKIPIAALRLTVQHPKKKKDCS